jgi:hypothetical protein
VFRFICDGWQNQATCLLQVLPKAHHLLPKPLKFFEKLLENILQIRQWFLNGIHISRLVESVNEDEHSEQPSIMLKKF